jgi:hypothetical protein
VVCLDGQIRVQNAQILGKNTYSEEQSWVWNFRIEVHRESYRTVMTQTMNTSGTGNVAQVLLHRYSNSATPFQSFQCQLHNAPNSCSHLQYSPSLHK